MSTKTTLKRVSLVAVAAMGIGLLTAVPSQAAPTLANTTMYDTTNGYQIVGGQATVTLTVDTSSTTSSNTVVVTGVGSVVSATATGTPTATVVGTPTSGSFSVTGTTGPATVSIVLASSVAGTQTISVTPLLSNGSPGTAVTKTITWLASGTTAVSASTSTVWIAPGITTPTSLTTATAKPMAAQTLWASAAANILVTPKDANGSTLASETLSATISGPGMLGIGTTPNATGRALTGAAGGYTIAVFGDGTPGVATVTISDGATVLGTKTVTFVGNAATYAATPSFTNYAVGANGVNGTTGNGAIAVKVTDANGNLVTDGTSVYAVSSNAAVATVISTALTTVSGYVYFAVQGVGAGTATITFKNAITGPTVTTTSEVTVTSKVASTVTLAFDKTSYVPGEKMVLTLTAKDSTGAGLADGTYAAFLVTPGLTSNVALQGFPAAFTAATLAAGVQSWTLYAPLAAGTITVTSTTGVSANLATAVQSLALTASADVSNPSSDAATDAANAATDAANYAADAADAATTAAQEATAAAVAAQESADAATAAVVALGLRVDTLLASVRAQLTSIANLIKRILAKKK